MDFFYGINYRMLWQRILYRQNLREKHGINKTHFQNPPKTYTALTRLLHHTSRDLLTGAPTGNRINAKISFHSLQETPEAVL